MKLVEAAKVETRRPVGYTCRHVTITSAAGVIRPPVTAWCGCELRPVWP